MKKVVATVVLGVICGLRAEGRSAFNVVWEGLAKGSQVSWNVITENPWRAACFVALGYVVWNNRGMCRKSSRKVLRSFGFGIERKTAILN